VPATSKDPELPGKDTLLRDLGRKSVRGGIFTIGSQAANFGIQLTSTVILARLLTPDDYGMLAMVMTVTAFAGLFRDLGLSSAAIQKKELTHPQQSNLFWLNVGMGLALTILVAALAPLVARFYGRPELTHVTMALSFTFLLGSLSTQHGARLVREMQFGRQAVCGIFGNLTALAVSIVLAIGGYSYWALVWGNLFGGVVITIMLLTLAPFRPSLPSRGTGLREMLKFGANVTAFDLVNYFQRNLDNLLIGRFSGSGPLGLYSRAYSLLMFPINAIRGPINAVAFPALSKLQDSPAEFRTYFLNTTSIIAWLSMPLTAFIFIASAPLVEFLLGKEWSGVSIIFSYLAIAAFIQPAAGFVGSLVLSLGQGRRYLQCGSFNAVVISIGFVIGIQWGPVGVAISYVICGYIVFYPWIWWALRESPVRFSDFLGACAFPAITSFVGMAGAWLARESFAAGPPIFDLTITGLAFALCVVSLIAFTSPGRMQFAAFCSFYRSISPRR
jgi:PST family polysaccharide transporter